MGFTTLCLASYYKFVHRRVLGSLLSARNVAWEVDVTEELERWTPRVLGASWNSPLAVQFSDWVLGPDQTWPAPLWSVLALSHRPLTSPHMPASWGHPWFPSNGVTQTLGARPAASERGQCSSVQGRPWHVRMVCSWARLLSCLPSSHCCYPQ